MEQINITALLKDCPKGTKLYSPIMGECELEKVYYCSINVRAIGNQCVYAFQETGKTTPCGECLLFPSKEVRDWNYWQADYVKLSQDKDKNLKMLKLLNKEASNHLDYSNFGTEYIGVKGRDGSLTVSYKGSEIGKYILSTGTELKLEEEQPKFKVGDVVRDRTGAMGIVKGLGEKGLIEIEYPYTNAKGFLLPTSLSSVSPEEIKGWNEKGLHPKHYHYSQSKRKIIDWFMPFDKVIVRKQRGYIWIAMLFSHFTGDSKPYSCGGFFFGECLPYNENTAKLIGTTDDYVEE